MNTTLSPRLLTEVETATYLSLSRGYLRRLRMLGDSTNSPGPPFCRIGSAIRYDIQDLEKFIEARKRGRVA